ncbi:MAG: aminotransferase [Planctomycetota bacterium]
MTLLDARHLFTHALRADPDRLHFAAHSHHLWPDATRAAQERAWLDAAERADEKWSTIFGEVYPAAQANVARHLSVADPTQVAFAANTHELWIKLLSGLPAWHERRPLRVLSTNAEFHSFTRQMRRFVESGRAEWIQVAAEPFASLPERMRAAANAEAFDVVFASHVFYSSGHVFDEVFEILAELPDEVTPIVDAYHGFFALPTDFGPYAERLCYLAGGYKYAMCGEGASFLVAPHGRAERPEITGWFAGFSSMKGPQSERVGYDAGAARFLGATLEPTPLYRFNAVSKMLRQAGLTIGDLHEHSRALQESFLEHVARGQAGALSIDDLVPGRDEVPGARRGNFLTFRRDDAEELYQRYLDARIVTDVRADRLRFGFGLYHVAADVEALVERLAGIAPG